MTLTEFVTARLDDAEEDGLAPSRVLVDVDAKRRLMEVAAEVHSLIDGEWGCPGGQRLECPGEEILALLALPWADHPDYQKEWKP